MAKIIFEHTVEGQHTVKLTQTSKNRFTVRYGHQVRKGLSYSEAARELGADILHACGCAGRFMED